MPIQWSRGLRRGSAAVRFLRIVSYESRRWHWRLSVVSVVCCQVEISVSGWSLAQRSLTECGVSECNRETSIMGSPWSTGGGRGWLLCRVKKIYAVTSEILGYDAVSLGNCWWLRRGLHTVSSSSSAWWSETPTTQFEIAEKGTSCLHRCEKFGIVVAERNYVQVNYTEFFYDCCWWIFRKKLCHMNKQA